MSEMENTSINKRVWGLWATAGFGFVVLIMSSIIPTLVAVVFALVNTFSRVTTSSGPLEFEETLIVFEGVINSYAGLILALSTFASMIICVGLVLIIIKVRKSVSIAEYLGLSQISAKTIFVVLAITVGFIILSDYLSLLLGRPLSPDYMVHIYDTRVWPVLFWAAIVIFGPISEETFFRGFLFEGFRQSRIGSTGAIGLTALVWALMHVQYDFYGIATIFVVGIVLGIVRLKTGSLWTTLIMHSFINLVATAEVALNLNRLVS